MRGRDIAAGSCRLPLRSMRLGRHLLAEFSVTLFEPRDGDPGSSDELLHLPVNLVFFLRFVMLASACGAERKCRVALAAASGARPRHQHLPTCRSSPTRSTLPNC